MPLYTVILPDGRRLDMPLPFKMSITTDSELYLRVAWFWKKEPDTLTWINLMPENAIMWDIGANVGCYSLFAISQHPGMTVHAFEPFKPNFDALKANIELNGWWHNIKPQFFALSDECGMVNFETNKTEVGSSGGQIGRHKDFVQTYSWPVDAITGDEYERLYGPPNYIKIDVDGQELRVLNGMKGVLAAPEVKGILVEQNEDKDAIENLLRGFNFVPDDQLNAMKNRKSNTNCIWRRDGN